MNSRGHKLGGRYFLPRVCIRLASPFIVTFTGWPGEPEGNVTTALELSRRQVNKTIVQISVQIRPFVSVTPSDSLKKLSASSSPAYISWIYTKINTQINTQISVFFF